MKLDAGEPFRRAIARQNGWLILLTMPPMFLLGGLCWYFESPSLWRFLGGVVLGPVIFAAIGCLGIAWGKRGSDKGR